METLVKPMSYDALNALMCYQREIVKLLAIDFDTDQLCEIIARHGKTMKNAYLAGCSYHMVANEIRDFEQNIKDEVILCRV